MIIRLSANILLSSEEKWVNWYHTALFKKKKNKEIIDNILDTYMTEYIWYAFNASPLHWW